jgi:hypothetical protein
MNLLVTQTIGHRLPESELFTLLQKRHHIVKFLPMRHLRSYLLFSKNSSLALVDAIVCIADGELLAFSPSIGLYPLYPFEQALDLAEDIHALPENCAMRDGRKWKSIPFIIFRSVHDYYKALAVAKQTHAEIVFRPYQNPFAALFYIQEIVSRYEVRVINDYINLGILIRFKNGRSQIGPALSNKNPDAQSEYYYSPSDRRKNKSWVTVSRDTQGLRTEIRMFEHLIDTGATESEMHRFFEENPSFLMQARLGIPISHPLSFSEPRKWTPDFLVSPVFGPSAAQEVELMELKGPAEKVLIGRVHPGFSAKVHRAIDQVRDYDRFLRNPHNDNKILETLGYIPRQSKLAVLIGRKPKETHNELFARRQSELDVQIVTYDEILETQTDQLTT